MKKIKIILIALIVVTCAMFLRIWTFVPSIVAGMSNWNFGETLWCIILLLNICNAIRIYYKYHGSKLWHDGVEHTGVSSGVWMSFMLSLVALFSFLYFQGCWPQGIIESTDDRLEQAIIIMTNVYSSLFSLLSIFWVHATAKYGVFDWDISSDI